MKTISAIAVALVFVASSAYAGDPQSQPQPFDMKGCLAELAPRSGSSSERRDFCNRVKNFDMDACLRAAEPIYPDLEERKAVCNDARVGA